MENIKHHVDKVEDESKVHVKRKEHGCEFNLIIKVTKHQSRIKIVIENIKWEMGNLKHNVDKLQDENKAHMKRKEHHCEFNHISMATKTH
jgi:hypothetical protein